MISDSSPTLTDSQLYELGAWVNARYVRGMQIREDDGSVRPIKMLECLADRHWSQTRRDQALKQIERYGCCMQFCDRFEVHVEDEDDHDSSTRTRTVLYCGRTDEPCPRAKIENIVALFSILNSERPAICQPAV